MIESKKIKSLSQGLFFLILLGLLTTTLNTAHAMGKSTVQESTAVDEIALEVEKLKSEEEVSLSLEQTLQAIAGYKVTIRQLRRGLFFDGDQKETEKAVQATEDFIQEQERKASLLRLKLTAMTSE